MLRDSWQLCQIYTTQWQRRGGLTKKRRKTAGRGCRGCRILIAEAPNLGTFCTSRGKQCLYIKECPVGFLSNSVLFYCVLIVLPCFVSFKQKLYFSRYMCTTDPAQCSTEQCHCEDPSHVRKAVSFRMRWVNKKGSENCQIARKCRRWIGQLAICCTLKLSITDHRWKTSSQWCPQTWTEVYAFSSWLSLVALTAFSYIQMVAFSGTANLSAMSR